MTIQDLGSIGEVVGAIATVGTLLYLAAQIRANTHAVQAEARRSHFAAGRSNNTSIIENADVAELFQRGLTDPESLDAVEQTRFDFLMASFFNNAELGFFEQADGVIEGEDSQRSIAATVRFLRAPVGRASGLGIAESTDPRFEIRNTHVSY